MRTAEFESSYASRGVRTCSNNLVLLAERWREAEPYRDLFEVLSKAVPLENDPRTTVSRRLTHTDLADLERLIDEVRHLGVHFRTLDMVQQIFLESQTKWTERGRRHSPQVSPYDIPLGLQSYSQVHQPTRYSGRYSDTFDVVNWDSGLAEVAVASRAADLNQRLPAYFGLGDPWTDPPDHI